MTMQLERPVDWARELPRLRLPVLLLHGEKDFACTLETQQYIQSLIPVSRLVVFQGAGHLPAMVRPMEVAAEIDAFFKAR
jgi:magnesium chelatase accessory protein